jgi:guanylate kinase
MAEQLLGNLSKGLIFVLSAPAGTGKTTLVKLLKEEFSSIVESVSCTTRKPRVGEVDGKDYHFISQEQFKKKIAMGDFLEYAEVFGNFYGTSREYVLLEQARGKHLLLVIDTQGAMQIREKIDAIFIFLSPPSMEVLRERLYQRKTESVEEAERRLLFAKEEMAMIQHYDYCIINENLDVAYQVLRSIVIAEERRVR